MTEHEVKKMMIPIETHLASLCEVLSVQERRSNPRLMKKCARLRLKVAQMKAFTNRVVRSKAQLPGKPALKESSRDEAPSAAAGVAKVAPMEVKYGT